MFEQKKPREVILWVFHIPREILESNYSVQSEVFAVLWKVQNTRLLSMVELQEVCSEAKGKYEAVSLTVV